MDFGIIALFLVFLLLSPFLFFRAVNLAYQSGENARSVFGRAIVPIAFHLVISIVVGFLLLVFVIGPEPRYGPQDAMTYPERAVSYSVALVYGAIVYLLCCSIPMKINLLFRRNKSEEVNIDV